MKVCKNCGISFSDAKYLYLISEDYCYECNKIMKKALEERKDAYVIDAIEIKDDHTLKIISEKLEAFENYFIKTNKFKSRSKYMYNRNYPSIKGRSFIKEFIMEGKRYVKDDNNIYVICLIDKNNNTTCEINEPLKPSDDLFIINVV